MGPLTFEELQDLSSEKSLELMMRLERGDWVVDTDAPEQTASFLSTVARNAVIDHQRRRKPQTDPEETDYRHVVSSAVGSPQRPDVLPERGELVAAIVECVSTLKDVHRRIWLFRVLLELSTRDISLHPDVQLTAGNVDVILQRCRAVRQKLCREQGVFDIGVAAGCIQRVVAGVPCR